MASVEGRMEQIVGTLQQIRDMLEADGYALEMKPTGAGLTLQVLAGEGACEECLVSKSLFLSLVDQALDDAGVSHADLAVDVVYPLDSHH